MPQLRQAICYTVMWLAFGVCSVSVYAEGSRDLINNGGQRAFFLSTTVVSEYNPFPTLGTVKVYAKVGEIINMGSSAQGIGNGRIVAKSPNGTSYPSDAGVVGRIDDINQELAGPLPAAGGYVPYVRTVLAGEEGIWEINFISPDATKGAGGSRPGFTNVLSPWTQGTGTAYISAFDVTVKNAANMELPGRAYMDVYGGSLGDAKALFYAKFKILTKDGYIYDVDNNGQAGYIFTFFVNNKGFRDAAGNAIYKSVNTSTNPPVHDPRAADSGTDITHKIFFAEPNPDLPQSSVIAGGGSTWLLKQPVSPSASNFLFTGTEGTLYKGGTYPLGGTITFEANQAINYSINLDINKNGSFTDPADLTLTGITTVGTNTRFWDGLDGEGNPVLGSLSFNPSNMKITLRGGEIHFPFMDVENNVTGIIIKRTNGVNSPDDIIYWDDDVSGITGGGKQLNGISSTANGHKWGTTEYKDTGFGNLRGLDTWTYVESAPINPLMNVELRQADLEVVSIVSNKATYCVGEEISYTIKLKNNGPDDVKGAKFAFNYPVGFEFISVTPTQTMGLSTLSNNSSNSTQFTVTADMQNQAVLTLVIKGKTNNSGSLNGVSATIMRPADVTDPDATNPDSAVPTDPLAECNSGGCNNIKNAVSVSITTRSITIQNATVKEKTNALSEIFFPVSIPAISSCDVSVDWTISHISTNAADFDASQSLSGTVVIAAGTRTTNIRVLLNADNIIEGNETFTVTLSNPIGGYLNNLSAVGTIENDDIGAITVTKTDGAEAGSVAGSFIFRFPSGVTSDVNTEVDYVLSGTALAGADYVGSATGTVVILAGTNSVTLPLPVNDDDIVEGDETITIALTRLFNAHSGTVTNNSPVTPIITITDNDFGQLILSDDVVLTEGNNGTTNATFTLTLNKATGSYFTLNYATSDVTAKVADNDYVPSGSVQLNFSGFKDEFKTITILVNGDTKIEGTELFNLLISNLSDSFSNRLTIPKALGTVTITNDDAGVITITKADGEEGINSGAYLFSFPPGLTTDVPVIINYSLTGTAVGMGIDYVGSVTGSVTILPGQNSVALVLPIVDDTIVEGTETIEITASAASNPYGISVANSPQTIQIIDNDLASLTISPASVMETDSGTPIMSFDVTLSDATATGFSLEYTTADGTATVADGDYISPAAGSTLNFNGTAGEVRRIDILLNGDRKIENDEWFNVILGSLSNTFNNNLTFFSTSATGTILNDDSGVVTITKVDGAEAGSVNGSFPFSLPPGYASDKPIVINYTLGGTATRGVDYSVTEINSITIPAGQNSVTLQISVNDDVIVEGDETISLMAVTVNSPYSSISLNPIIPTLTIADNDNATLVLTGPVAFNETAIGTVAAKFTVKLDKATTNGFSVSFSTEDGTASVSDNDYIANSGTLSFTGSAGETKTITVMVNGDTKVEADETFLLKLLGLSNTFGGRLTIPLTSIAATILNDDVATIQITKSNGAEGSYNASFTFSLPIGVISDKPVTINYTLSGTATAGADYTGVVVSSITIPAGQNSVSLALPILDDQIVERTETIILSTGTVTSGYGFIVSNPIVSLDILDNDNAKLTISTPIAISEGNAGTTVATFNVTLDKATSNSFTLDYTTADGTATIANADYNSSSGILSFNGNANEVRTISVTINGDTNIESDETYSVLLSGLSDNFNNRLIIPVTAATGRILNDDGGDITITSSNGFEAGSIPATFTFSFPPGVTNSSPTEIEYSLDGSALAGTDYSGVTSSIIIPANQNSVTLTLPVIDDAIVEDDETINISTGLVSNSQVVVNTFKSLSIIDNDLATLTIDGPVSVTESNSGTVNAKFTVTLEKATASPFSINYATKDGTALFIDNDYIAQSGSLNFAGSAGETQIITVLVNGDTQIEADETFTVHLSDLTNTFSNRLTVPLLNSTGVIKNDDSGIITISKSGGEEGVKNVNFTFSLPSGITADIPTVIDYSLAGTAVGDGTDYTGPVLGTVVIQPGQNSAILSLPVVDDAVLEDTETVILSAGTVTSPYGITVTTDPQSVDIIDNDRATLTINPIVLNEGDAGTTVALFKVLLSNATGSPFTVKYTTTDGTATVADADYVSKSGVLSFAGIAGEEQIIEVIVNGDKKIEADETFNAVLSDLSHNYANRLTIPTPSASATIVNDDSSVITITPDNGSETGPAAGKFNFGFQPGYSSDKPVIINYTLNGTAQSGGVDYSGNTSGTLTIPAGANSFPLTFPVIDDNIVEDSETISITTGTISSPYALNVLNSPQTLLINDNDIATLSLSTDVVITEGDSGTKNAIFTVKLDKATASSFTLGYATSDGTAKIADNDYISSSGILSFSGTPNEVKTISIVINGDTKIEADERFNLTLKSLSNTFNGRLTIPELSRTVTIKNDDLGVVIISKVNGEEGVQDGSFTFSYPVGMRADIPLVIDYSLGGTATSGLDYTGTSSSVTLPAGQNSVTVNFPVIDDDVIEHTETIEMVATVASNPYGIAVSNTPLIIDILDNDTGGLTITGGSVIEGNSGTQTLDFTVTLNKATRTSFTVGYSTSDGTATIADDDYIASNGIITFAGISGESHTISVAVKGDTRIESNETLKVALKNLSETFSNRLSVLVPSDLGTISDDDNGIITITKSDGAEEGSVPGKFIFSFQSGTVSDKPTTVNYTLGGTAGGNGQDYTGATTGSVIIPAGQNSVSLLLPVIDDNIVEGNETVSIINATVNSVYTGISVNPAFPTLTIVDNDSAKLLLSDDVVVNEGDNGTVNVTFTVTLDKSTNGGFTLGYSTSDATASIADDDYIHASGMLNFAGTAGESKAITIVVKGDTKIEANEVLNLSVGSLSNIFGGMLTVPVTDRIVTIKNDDTAFLTITKTDGREGVQGASFSFSFPPGLSTDIPVIINYSLGGTALGAGVDYIGASPSTITLPAGQNSITLSLPVIDDDIIEDSETIDIVASTVSNAYGITIANPAQSLNVLDNDDAVLSISSASITEGDAGTKNLEFVVTLNKATGSAFTVTYATSDGTATVADNDYMPSASNATLSFAGIAGETQTVSVVVNSDRKIEQNETFNVTLKSLSNNFNNRLTIKDATATGTIVNDDTGIITITHTDGSETGPAAGSFIFSFQAGLTSDQPTTINYALAGTAGGNGMDYIGATSGSAIIPAGQNSVKLILPVIDDNIIEDDETISIVVTSVNSIYSNSISVNPSIPNLIITDNDFANISIRESIELAEGNNGTTPFKFEVSLDKGTGLPFTVSYATADGSATSADNDYIPSGNASLSFAGTAGETHIITVLVKGDLKMEPDETFSLALTALSNTFGNRLRIQGSPAMGTIKNDDSGEIIITKIDGTEGLQDGRFVFSFPQGVTSDGPTIINYRLSGTATSADYTAPTVGSITIPAGKNSVSLALPVIDDDVLEESETVVLSIDNISNTNNNITWMKPIPTVTIFDNDRAELTLVGPPPVLERNNGKTTVTFTVKLNNLTSKGFEVDYTTVNATATVADKDYEFKSGRLTFAGFPGETKEITVDVYGDIKVESDETFSLVLDAVNPSFAGRLTVSGTPAVVTILNDDYAPLAIADAVTTLEDTPVTFSVVANDIDADGIDPKTIKVTSFPVKGDLKVNNDGTVTYTPVLNDFGTYRFTYTVKDILGLVSNEAVVTIHVSPVNDAPVAEDDMFFVFKGSSIRETVAGNDSDPDGDPLQFKLLSSTKNGQLQFFSTSDGSFIYTPEKGFVGKDGFSYEINDPSGLTDKANVILNVQPNVTVSLTPLVGIITEGDTISVTAQLSEPLLQDVTVILNYTGTAVNNKDYNLTGNHQSITIPTGSTTTNQRLIVSGIKDYLKEDDEEINIRIATATPSAFVTIGAGSDITIKDYYPDEENAGPDANPDINPDPLTSPNGDGIGNEKFVIHNIEKYPDNEVMIFNRWGNEVFRIQGYNNDDKSFKGIANKGILANSAATLADGVYYFIIYTKDSTDKRKMNKGYVIIKR